MCLTRAPVCLACPTASAHCNHPSLCLPACKPVTYLHASAGAMCAAAVLPSARALVGLPRPSPLRCSSICRAPADTPSTANTSTGTGTPATAPRHATGTGIPGSSGIPTQGRAPAVAHWRGSLACCCQPDVPPHTPATASRALAASAGAARGGYGCFCGGCGCGCRCGWG